MYVSFADSSGAVPLSQLFQKPADTWECPTCMITNKNSAVTCAACSCPNPTAGPDVVTVSVESLMLTARLGNNDCVMVVGVDDSSL